MEAVKFSSLRWTQIRQTPDKDNLDVLRSATGWEKGPQDFYKSFRQFVIYVFHPSERQFTKDFR